MPVPFFVRARHPARVRATSWLRLGAGQRLLRLLPVIVLLWFAVAWALGDAG